MQRIYQAQQPTIPSLSLLFTQIVFMQQIYGIHGTLQNLIRGNIF